MTRQIRTAVTLLVLLVVVSIGGAWAWSAFTSPLPEGGLGGSTDDVCTDNELAAGSRLRVPDVTVSVVNAGTTSGAAARTLGRLGRTGFDEGLTGDAPDDADVTRAQIWTDEPQSPAVRLVASWLGEDIIIEERDVDLPGVYVVVGDDFEQLRDGRRGLPVDEPTTVCGPPA